MMNRSQPPGADARRGFTLVEMLVAAALVMIFGLLCVATLRYGLDLWRAGHRRSYCYDAAASVFNQLEDDLLAARNQFWTKEANAYDTRVKFYVDRDDYFGTGAVYPTEGHQRLRLVRGIPNASANPLLRAAGDGASSDDDNGDGSVDSSDDADEEFYNLQDDDGDMRIDEDLMPLGGMCEVAYLMGLDTADAYTLYRAVLAPIGYGPADLPVGWPDPPADWPGYSLFLDNEGPPTYGGGTDYSVFGTAQRIRDKGRAITDNVILHFEIRNWTQYTNSWDSRVPFQVWAFPYLPVPCGPSFAWDSDRLYSDGTVHRGPDFDMDPGQPGFPRDARDENGDGVENEIDETYVRDNVFPKALMAIVVVEPPDNLRPIARLRLSSDIDDNDDVITVSGPLPPHNEAWRYIRIGDEWIRFSQFDAAAQELIVDTGGRGARFTDAVGHNAGDEVLFGYTFTRVFNDPTGRDYWGQ